MDVGFFIQFYYVEDRDEEFGIEGLKIEEFKQ